jgi:hypothetical protein
MGHDEQKSHSDRAFWQGNIKQCHKQFVSRHLRKLHVPIEEMSKDDANGIILGAGIVPPTNK